MSNQKHVTELIPAYAVSCLDVAESLQVARHLASCAACQAELSRYEAVVDQLSLAVPEAEPTVDLKARLLDQIERPSARIGRSDNGRFPATMVVTRVAEKFGRPRLVAAGRGAFAAALAG
jgi:anti-sigma factor RsiW